MERRGLMGAIGAALATPKQFQAWHSRLFEHIIERGHETLDNL